MDKRDLSWLEKQAKRQLKGCQIVAHDGTILYTPDGEGNYAALWTRDYAYMVENAYHMIPEEHIKSAINYLLNGQREDGCIPDRVQADGLAVYSAGPVNNPLGDPPTDNSQFMVSLVYHYVVNSGDYDFFRQNIPRLVKALDYTPRNGTGLVYIDPENPHSPYGFTDTIQKTGELLFSSLLYWQACKQMAELFERIHEPESQRFYNLRAKRIESNIDLLWDDEVGMFLAASQDCRQVDIWGNAYALYINFPVGDKRYRIVNFLATHYDRYVLHGQVRHLLEPEHWQKTLVPVKPGTYQNGGYWGTASGWVAVALREKHPELARRMHQELLAYYREFGPHEWINREEKRLPNYVASVVNPLGAVSN